MSDRPALESTGCDRIAFFGHDVADAAIRRRVLALQADGFEVTGYMMRRRPPLAQEWPGIDLGQTRDGAFLQRILQVFRGARIAARPGAALARADLIYARNLDMLACAFLARRQARLTTPIIYECLDIHRLLCRPGPIGWALRALERALLKRSAALIVSSPAFMRHHFDRYYPGLSRSYLIENRLSGSGTHGLRPKPTAGGGKGPLRLGWAGNLRCNRSLGLLCLVAARFGDQVEIRLHGVPALKEVPDFEKRVAEHANMSFHGRYRSPEDLAGIYGGLDVVWAGDFMEAGLNSVWLLPNRLYEGGYHCTPPVAPASTETGRWIEERGCGFTLPEPLEESFPALVGRLLSDRCLIKRHAEVLADLPEDTFVEPSGFLRHLLQQAMTAQVSR